MKKIIFVTGTDTGVGKTLLSCLLLFHLRQKGVNALAIKPFCSGSRNDVHRLQALQRGELSDDEVNPYYFTKPLAPRVAAGKRSKQIHLADVIEYIRKISAKCDRLIVEGAGGLLVPLGEDFKVLDVINELDCQVIITARNRLGTINHTLLTINALKQSNLSTKHRAVTLMSVQKPDLSARSNSRMLSKLLHPIRIVNLPFLGKNAAVPKRILLNHLKLARALDQLTK